MKNTGGFTSDGLLAIGGKDASSNSVIIRKLLTENDCNFLRG